MKGRWKRRTERAKGYFHKKGRMNTSVHKIGFRECWLTASLGREQEGQCCVRAYGPRAQGQGCEGGAAQERQELNPCARFSDGLCGHFAAQLKTCSLQDELKIRVLMAGIVFQWTESC